MASTRRDFIKASAAAGGALGLGLVGCGGDDGGSLLGPRVDGEVLDQFGNALPVAPLVSPSTAASLPSPWPSNLVYPVQNGEMDLASFGDGADPTAAAIDRDRQLREANGAPIHPMVVTWANSPTLVDEFVEVYDSGPFGLPRSVGGTYQLEPLRIRNQPYIEWTTRPNQGQGGVPRQSQTVTHYFSWIVQFPDAANTGFTWVGAGVKGFELFFSSNPGFDRIEFGGWVSNRGWQNIVRDATNPIGDTGDTPAAGAPPSGGARLFDDILNGDWWMAVIEYRYAATAGDGTGAARLWWCRLDQDNGQILDAALSVDLSLEGAQRDTPFCTQQEAMRAVRSTESGSDITRVQWWGNFVASGNGGVVGEPYPSSSLPSPQPFRSCCFRWWTGPNPNFS